MEKIQRTMKIKLSSGQGRCQFWHPLSLFEDKNTTQVTPTKRGWQNMLGFFKWARANSPFLIIFLNLPIISDTLVGNTYFIPVKLHLETLRLNKNNHRIEICYQKVTILICLFTMKYLLYLFCFSRFFPSNSMQPGIESVCSHLGLWNFQNIFSISVFVSESKWKKADNSP